MLFYNNHKSLTIPMWRKGIRFLSIVLIVAVLTFFTTLHLRLFLSVRVAPKPQAILTLGGGDEREEYAAQFAKYHPKIPIWISSGLLPEQTNLIFQRVGIDLDRLHLDYRATDTVTNFTTLADDFNRQGIRHIYLITSDFHMPRAKAIAFVVFGSRGIAYAPLEVYSGLPHEPRLQVGRDMGRSIVWLATGRTGASLKTRLFNR